ncbi:hypothetical protein BMF94_3842, partial [Rhodotorula taiwanensis]
SSLCILPRPSRRCSYPLRRTVPEQATLQSFQQTQSCLARAPRSHFRLASSCAQIASGQRPTPLPAPPSRLHQPSLHRRSFRPRPHAPTVLPLPLNMRLSLFLSGLVAASSAIGVYAQIPNADLVDQSPAEPLHHNEKRLGLCLFGVCVGGSIDFDNDVNNCGSTGFKCQTSWANGSGAKCSSGRCMPLNCAAGFTLNTVTASCVNTANDVGNCGTCGNVCSLPGANGHTCSAGVCQATSCISGYGLYSGSCKNLASDSANCGTLGNVCQFPGGTGICNAGKCTLTGCGNGYYSVGGKCQQLNLQTDPLNCGSIGKVCSVPNGVPGCSGGSCTIASCSPGYQLATQGSLLGLFGSSASCTPIDTSSSFQNCGSIGHACAFANGNGVCQSGTCKYTSCTTPGYYL